jgi:DNA-binding transcriptional regulator LsrR (DeoR family)
MTDTTYNEVELQKVATLLCEGIPEPEIADMLSVPQSEIRQMIENAEQLGFLKYYPRLSTEVLLPETTEFVYNETLTNALRAALKDSQEISLVHLRITRSPTEMFSLYSTAASEESEDFRDYRAAEFRSLQRTAGQAAEYISRKLFDGADHTVGVNWGMSVRRTIDGIRPVPSELSEAKITVVSLFGDLDFHPQQASASRIESESVNCNGHVEQLAFRLGGRAEAVPLNVPGFIPAEFSRDPKTFSAIRRFLGSHASYRRIFGDLPGDDPTKPRPYNGIIDVVSDARITHMDTVITGFGSADTYTDTWHFLKFWLDDAEIQTLLRHCAAGDIAGDIAGHLVPSEDGEANDELKRFLRSLNQRILAAQPSDLVDAACRNRKTGIGAGVVGVTIGARKAKIVARLLGLSPSPVSALFIDTHCALALLAELSQAEFRRFVRGRGRPLVAELERWSPDTRRLIPA